MSPPDLPLQRILLRLYVSGQGPLSLTAQDNVERIRELVGMPCDIEVVDVIEDPDAAERERIIITPTLIRVDPGPQLRVAGELNDPSAALDALGIRAWSNNHRRRPG